MRKSILTCCLILLVTFNLPYGTEIPEPVHKESIIAQTMLFEKELEKTGVFINDSSMNFYLNGILQKVAPDSANLSIKVLKSSTFNAFAAPHGTIYICTGLLAKIQNEAQFAALLGHEMVHILRDHACQNLINTKKKALSSARMQIGLEFFIGSLAGTVGNLTLKSAISGYCRELEREADSLGLIRMREAGYAPIEFRNLFMILKNHIEHENIKQPFFFATHPAVSERISNYYSFAGVDTIKAAQGLVNSEVFNRMIKCVLQTDGIMKIAAGDLVVAESNFSRILESDTCNSPAYMQLGNITRLRSAQQISEHVFKWYNRAKGCDSTGEVLRELGFYYFKSGNPDSSVYYLKQYQSLYPLSPYKPVIEDYLKKCVR